MRVMRRNRFRDFGLTQEMVEEWYLRQNKTDAEMAVIVGVTDAAMSYFRRKCGIPTRGQLARLTFNHTGPNFKDITPVELATLYTSMGDRAIAARYGVSKPTIRAKRAQFAIESLSKSVRATSTEDLTEEQREIILGSLLGDGHLLERGVFKVSHYQEQFDYLTEMHRALSPHTLPIWYEEKEMDNGRQTFAFGFRTVQHEWLKAIRHVFYPNGDKVFPDTVLSILTPRSLAYWYFDDGHLDSGLPSFALGEISGEQTEQVCRQINQRFGLIAYRKTSNSSSSELMGLRAASADAFFTLIRDFATRDLLYKLPPKHWPRGVVPKTPLKTPDLALLPKGLSDEAKIWASLGEVDQASLVEGLAEFWTANGFPYHTPRPEELVTLAHLDASHVIQDGIIKARQVGQGICQGIGRHIWEGHSYGCPSPLELFIDPVQLRGAISYCLRMEQIPNAARLRAALRYWRRTGVYNFRPSAAKTLIDRYCPPGGTVFDPCAGYGGRLLGSILSKSRPKYIGCEPSSASFDGLHKLHRWVCSYLPEFEGRVLLHSIPAEDFDFPQGVDVVLTSPPYWKRETYSEEETQSGHRYTTYDIWLERFWGPVIRKSVEALRTGGWLILNVDNFSVSGKDYALVDDTLRLVAECGLGRPESLVYELPGGTHESVLCWSKGVTTVVVNEPVKSVELPQCHGCGTTVVSGSLCKGLCIKCVIPKGYPKVCVGCSCKFVADRNDQEFHSPNCYATHRRRLKREAHPYSGIRVFTCVKCSIKWETKELGRFSLCFKCKEAQDLEGRVKTCAYRNCGNTFTDTSSKNSMKFCSPEHGRREKAFRQGKAKDVTYFRSEKETGWRICQSCRERFLRAETDKCVRCPPCRAKSRQNSSYPPGCR